MTTRKSRDRRLYAETVKRHARPPTRTERIRARMAAGDWPGALKAATKMRGIGADAEHAIRRAWEACVRPEFQRQLGRDPEELIAAGCEFLRRQFGDP